MRRIQQKFISVLVVCALLLTSGVVTSEMGNTDSWLGLSQKVEAASINKKTATLYLGETLKLQLVGANKKVTWGSTNKSVATVSSSGKVTAKGKGKTRITGKAAGKTYTCSVTVKNTYRVKTSTKKTLKAAKGYSTVTYTQKSDRSVMQNRASIFLPSITDYSDGKYVARDETYNDTDQCYQISFIGDAYGDLSFFDSYVTDLEKYGFTLDYKFNSSWTSDSTLWYFTYTGSSSITKGLFDGSADGSADLQFFTYSGYDGSYVVVSYPSEVGFTFSQSDAASKSMTVATDYSVQGQRNRFEIKGWGESTQDSMIIYLNQGVCKKGKTYTLSDFQSQSAAGSSGLYSLYLTSPTINGGSTSTIGLDKFRDLKVKIVDKTASTLAIYYYAVVEYGWNQCTLEGLVVAYDKDAQKSTGNSGSDKKDSTSSKPIVTKNPCPSCTGRGYSESHCLTCTGRGYKSCIVCSGSGRLSCTKCGGDGRTWDGLNGRSTNCTYCYGTGRKNCDRCSGKGTWLCSDCKGKKKIQKTCIYCHGTGKK